MEHSKKKSNVLSLSDKKRVREEKRRAIYLSDKQRILELEKDMLRVIDLVADMDERIYRQQRFIARLLRLLKSASSPFSSVK